VARTLSGPPGTADVVTDVADAFAETILTAYAARTGPRFVMVLSGGPTARRCYECLATRAVGRISEGLQDKLYLGNLEARRDWGFAGDYVRAMWLMMQQETPDDFVVGTGEAHTVREFVELAFAHAGLDWKEHVEVDTRYFRPAEVDYLCADASKARRVLGWEPAVTFAELVRIMVEADMKEVESRLKGGTEALRLTVVAEEWHS